MTVLLFFDAAIGHVNHGHMTTPKSTVPNTKVFWGKFANGAIIVNPFPAHSSPLTLTLDFLGLTSRMNKPDFHS